MQLSFDFTETRKELTDKDGDVLVFNVFTDKAKTIAHFLKCTVCKAKEKRPPKQKRITLICTERQQMKARQLFYAHSIGFDINYRDYQKWHLL